MLALFRMGMGLSPMRTPKSLTGRAVQVRALCPWCPHCEHRLGPSPAPPPAPAAAAGGTPSRVMLGEVDRLGLGLGVGGIFRFPPSGFFFILSRCSLFLGAVGGVFIWGREKGSVEAERDTARGDELEIIFQRAEAIPYFF